MVKAYKSYPMLGHLHSGEHVKSTLKGSSVPVSLNRGPSCSEVTPCHHPTAVRGDTYEKFWLHSEVSCCPADCCMLMKWLKNMKK